MSIEQERDGHRDPNPRAPWPETLGSPSPSQGQIVMGPSFYIWDESPKQAREWGVELANAWLARRR